MTAEAAALRHGLTPDDRVLLRRLIDEDVRRRHAAEEAATEATKRRYLANKAKR